MPLKGNLTVEFADGREPVRFGFFVGPADELILRQFAAAHQTFAAAFQRIGGLPVSLNLSFKEGEGVKVSTEEPSEDQLAIMLHRLRPILLTEEPGSFDRTCGAVRRAADDEFIGKQLRRIRDIYSGADLRDQVVISRGELVLNSDTAFQHWLTGFEYHPGAKRGELVANADSLLPLQAVRSIFLMMLAEKLKAISMLALIADKLLERPVPDAVA